MEEATAELPMLALIFTRKLRPDDHRFALGMIHVCRDDGATGGDFLSDKFGRDDRADVDPCAEILTRMLVTKIGPRIAAFAHLLLPPERFRIAIYSISGVMMPRFA